MGSRQLTCTHYLLYLTASFLFLLLSSWSQLRFSAEGRTILRPLGHYQEDKVTLRGQIGSRPPRCESRCSSCGHCEAIQVPTNPGGKKSLSMSTIEFDRGEYNSNYKPMSWKCKCGNSILNP